jgi:hypothetical protein
MRAKSKVPQRPPASIGFVKIEGFIKFRALRETRAGVPRALRAVGTENLNDVRTILPLSGRDGTERDSSLSRRKAPSEKKRLTSRRWEPR